MGAHNLLQVRLGICIKIEEFWLQIGRAIVNLVSSQRLLVYTRRAGYQRDLVSLHYAILPHFRAAGGL